MRLRDYQEYAVDQTLSYFSDNDGNPLIVMPTGTGKSLVIAGLVRGILAYPNQRVVVATHVKELVYQNYEKMLACWPTAPVGIYSAGLKKREIRQVTICGIDSVADKAEDFGHVDILIVDEAHLLSPKEGSRYRLFHNGLRKRNPACKVIGLTATHYRLGQGLLTEDGLFTDISVDMSRREIFNWFIDEGYLSPLIPKKTRFEYDISSVQVVGKEYNLKQLQEAVDQTALTSRVVDEILTEAADRSKWLVFCSGIEHAESVAAALCARGISASYVHSKMGEKDRDKEIAAFRAGHYRAMCNNGILTTGFDDPSIDCIAMLRATKSTSLWVQMLGRGTRPVYGGNFDLGTTAGRLEAIACGGKRNCLVLDFAGNTAKLGPINDPYVPSKKTKGSGEAPVKLCVHCLTWNHASARFCVDCGEAFPSPQLKISQSAATDQLIVRNEDIVKSWFAVDHVVYAPIVTKKNKNALVATYTSGLRFFKKYLLFEQEGFARHDARNWWRAAAGDRLPAPDSVLEASNRLSSLRPPKRILVRLAQFPEIEAYEY